MVDILNVAGKEVKGTVEGGRPGNQDVAETKIAVTTANGIGVRTYQGIIDVSLENEPVLLEARAKTGKNDRILIGDFLPDNITGDSGDDLLFGEDLFDTLDGKGGDDKLDGGCDSLKLRSSRE